MDNISHNRTSMVTVSGYDDEDRASVASSDTTVKMSVTPSVPLTNGLSGLLPLVDEQHVYAALTTLAERLEQVCEDYRNDFEKQDVLNFFVMNFKKRRTGLQRLYKQLYLAAGCATVNNLTTILSRLSVPDGCPDLVQRFRVAEQTWDDLLLEIDDSLNAHVYSVESQAQMLNGEITLVDCDNNSEIMLKSLFNSLHGKYTLFVMLRFYGSQHCLDHVQRIISRLQEFQAHLCNVCLVCRGSRNGGTKWKRLVGVELPMLADEGQELIKALRFRESVWIALKTQVQHQKAALATRNEVATDVRPPSSSGGVGDLMSLADELEKERTTDDDIFQLGGNAIVDGSGRVLYLYRCRSDSDRPTSETLLAALPQSDAVTRQLQKNSTEQSATGGGGRPVTAGSLLRKKASSTSIVKKQSISELKHRNDNGNKIPIEPTRSINAVIGNDRPAEVRESKHNNYLPEKETEAKDGNGGRRRSRDSGKSGCSCTLL